MKKPPIALIKAAELVFKLGAEPSLSVIRRGLARVYRHLGRLNDALGVLDDAPEAHLERAADPARAGQLYRRRRRDGAVRRRAPYRPRRDRSLLAGQYAEALDAIAGRDDPDSALLRAQVYHLQGDSRAGHRGYHRRAGLLPDDEIRCAPKRCADWERRWRAAAV